MCQKILEKRLIDFSTHSEVRSQRPGKTNPEASGKLRDSQRLAHKRANEPADKVITQREAH